MRPGDDEVERRSQIVVAGLIGRRTLTNHLGRRVQQLAAAAPLGHGHVVEVEMVGE